MTPHQDTLIITLILSIVILLLASILFDKEKEILISEMEKRGKLILKNLAQVGWEAIINDNKTVTSDVFDEVMKDKSVLYAIVLDKNGNILPDCFLLPSGVTALDFANHIHSDLAKNFIKAIDVRTKQLLGKDYKLKHRDIIEIVVNR